MHTLLQISIEVNSGSVGRIAEQIGETVILNGWTSYITFARNNNPSSSNVIKIGNKFDVYLHGIETRIFDNHCFSSASATRDLVEAIKTVKPDIIHLHHLHGYYINIEILFDYLRESGVPIVWTFHDCWSFTGHCAHFDFVGCDKWKTGCYSCEQKNEYPASLIFDRSQLNYRDKKRIFNSIDNLTIVSVSNWLDTKVKDSFLNSYPSKVIQNGIDLTQFKPFKSRGHIDNLYGTKDKWIILGVASTWDNKKGLNDFIQLDKILDKQKFLIVLVGLSQKQISKLPKSILGIKRTENVRQLADLYSAADVFLNPTFEDTFPTTNLESLACGTPVITYNTGGSVESVSSNTGFIVDKGNIPSLKSSILEIISRGKGYYTDICRETAEKYFDKKIKFNEYLKLYNELINK